MMLPSWADMSSAEKMEIIRPLWLEGKSAGEITTYFGGATRNAVIGLVARAKLQRRLPASPKVRNERKMIRKPTAAREFVTVPDNDDAERVNVWDLINGNRPPLADHTPVSILDLPSREGIRCRFPVIGGYCGAPSGDKTYCEAHHRIMYRPIPKKRPGN